MSEAPYWHVDAFADRPFAGNQAAVMLLDAWPDDGVLQAIGAENLFAETAFVVPDASGATDGELRWFTPTLEAELCGHATLAAGHVLLSGTPERDAVCFATRYAGVLDVRRSPHGYEVSLPVIATESAEWPEAAALLGGKPSETRRSPRGYAVFLFDRAADVRALAPDLRGLAQFGDVQFIATAPGDETDVISRVFVPGAGIDEDSVTGSAHAALAPLWTQRLGRPEFTAQQASRRGARLACRLEGDRAWLAGTCVTVVEGRFRW